MNSTGHKEILEKVDALLENRRKPHFAVFDFDNTCIVGDITESTFAFLCERSLIKNKKLLDDTPSSGEGYFERIFRRYFSLLEEKKIKEAYVFISRAYAGFSLSEIGVLAEQTISFETDQPSKRILFGVEIDMGLSPRHGIVELFSALKERNIELWVVSASPVYLIEPTIKKFFSKMPLKVLGVENKVHEGVITAEILQLPMFEDKVAIIQKKIEAEQKPALAIGDSMNDFAMLEYAEIPVVIDRGNKLARVAKEHGWLFY